MRLRVHFLIALLFVIPASAQTWRPMGPPGGDVRSLAADPQDPRRIYLGTSDGHIFGTRDAGLTWQLLGRAGTGQDGVVTALVVDARNSDRLYAGVWAREEKSGGAIYLSDDGGRTWREAGLSGQAVRALVQSPSLPAILVAGTLDGVYRSRDATASWQRISPQGHEEIRNLDSLAIDSRNPETVYAGTFHLPWKTTDGGRHWTAIHDGMIDDSDVMALMIDRTNPRRLYASACSGIYRSDNAGAAWRKIQGIPFSARRTQVIRQDPLDAATIYAGTTEGLWKSSNAGSTWQRLTPRHWVVNALSVHAGRVLVGTDQLGVLVSDDAGKTFRAANAGFNHRQIVSLALDPNRPQRVLAVLANSPDPLLATEDGGKTWSPLGPGLKTEGVRRLYATPTGWWAALERGGLVRYLETERRWARASNVAGEAAVRTDRRGRRIPVRGPCPLDHVIEDMAFSHSAWFAATREGLLISRDSGTTWALYPVGPMTNLPVRSIRASADGRDLRVVSLRGMVFSRDSGKTWTWHDLPPEADGALRLDVLDDTTLLATARAGLYISRDAGKSWRQASSGLPEAPLQGLAVVGDVLVASMQTRGLFLSTDRGRTWSRIEGTLAEGHFPVLTADTSADVIFAASASEGLYAVELKTNVSPAASNGRSSSQP